MKKIIIITVIVAVVVGAGAFYGGTIYEKSSLNKQGLLRTAGTFGNRQFGQNGQGGANSQRPSGQNGQGRWQGGGFLNGEIMSKDDPTAEQARNGAGKSVTIKDRDGSSKIVFYSESTIIEKTINGNASDLNNGQQVMVNGQTNTDGTITAQNIQIRPADASASQPQN